MNIKDLIEMCKTTEETVGDITLRKELPESTLDVLNELIRILFYSDVQQVTKTDTQGKHKYQEYFNKHLELLHKSNISDVSIERILDSTPIHQDMNDREYKHKEHRKFEWNGFYKGGKFKLIMEEA